MNLMELFLLFIFDYSLINLKSLISDFDICPLTHLQKEYHASHSNFLTVQRSFFSLYDAMDSQGMGSRSPAPSLGSHTVCLSGWNRLVVS